VNCCQESVADVLGQSLALSHLSAHTQLHVSQSEALVRQDNAFFFQTSTFTDSFLVLSLSTIADLTIPYHNQLILHQLLSPLPCTHPTLQLNRVLSPES